MKKIVLLLCIILLFCGIVYAGNNTTSEGYIPVEQTVSDDDIVYALEDGHLNTNFSDGSKGYCLEYGEQEAHAGDKFNKVNTSYALNNNNNKSIDKYLKCLFIDYYNYTQSMPPIYTQHLIWYFTDDFYHPISIEEHMDIIEGILNCIHNYKDKGSIAINDTHSMFYEFNVLLSLYIHHQNYFTYNIWFDYTPQDNNTVQNQTNNITGQNNNTTENKSITDINNISKQTKASIDIMKNETGIQILVLIVAIIVLGAIFFKKRY